MAVSRTVIARLKRLLLARDVDQVLQGVQLAAALDDADVYEALLSGVTWSEGWVHRRRWRGPGLVGNALFTGTRPAQPYLDLALTLLVAHSPLQALKEQVVALRLEASHGGEGPPLAWLPLDGLQRYPNLRELAVVGPTRLGSLEPLGRCPSLIRLSLQERIQLSGDLRALGSSATLAELDLRGAAPLDALGALGSLRILRAHGSQTERLDFVQQLDALQQLTLSSERLASVGGLADHPRLASLTLYGLAAIVDLSAIATLQDLQHLELEGCAPLPGLDGLRQLQRGILWPLGWSDLSCLAGSTLTELDLHLRDEISLLGLSELPRLRILRLMSTASASLRGLPARLTRLELRGRFDLTTLPPTHVEHLSLVGARDLSLLARLEGLVSLQLEGTTTAPLPGLAPLHGARQLRELHLKPQRPISLEPLRDHPSLERVWIPRWRQATVEVPDDLRWLLG